MSVIQPNIPKKGFGTQLKDIPVSKRSGLIKFVIILALSAILWLPPLIYIIITGSPVGLTITNTDQYIGNAEFSFYIPDSNGTYQQTNGTLIFYDYYTDEQIGNGIADGTTYQFTNVSYAFVSYVESDDGYTYPNKTFLILANTTLYNNKIYFNPIGNSGEFTCTFYKIAKEDGSSAVYGTLGIADITTLAENNFTMSLQMENSGNGTFGENYYMPNEFRYNETIYNAGLWIKFNILLDSIVMNNNFQTIYYDGTGNSFIYLPTLSPQSQLDVNLVLQCQSLPTNIQIIQGQWNGTVLTTFS